MLDEGMRVASDPAVLEWEAVERAKTAWDVFSGRVPPAPILTLRGPRDEGKSVVLGLGPVGPGGRRVVAKELLATAADAECAIYQDILPALSLRGPELLGRTESLVPGRAWLFLEEVSGPPLDKRDRHHVAIASRWLGAFHVAGLDVATSLPQRGPDHYESLIALTLSEIDDLPSNPAIHRRHVTTLRRISGHLERLLSNWGTLAGLYLRLPASVVHGDFKANNMIFSGRVALAELRVFDWSEAHRGPWSTDLWWVDPIEYGKALATNGHRFRQMEVDDWRALGSMLRWVLAVSWEIPGLRYEWVERGMRRMATYEERLHAAIAKSEWLSI